MMKNNKLHLMSLPLIVFTLLLVTLLGSCGKTDKYIKQITKSSSDLVQVVYDVVAKDQDIVVFKYNKDLEVQEDGKGTLREKISKLNGSFVLEEKVNVEKLENVDKSKLLNFDFNKEYFASSEALKDKLTITVNKENVHKVFRVEKLDIKDTCKFEITFANKHVQTIAISFKTVSNIDVCANITCKY